MPKGTIPSQPERERRRKANNKRLERNALGPGGTQGFLERGAGSVLFARGLQELIETNRGLYNAYQNAPEYIRNLFGETQFRPRLNPNFSTSVPGQGGQRFTPNYSMAAPPPATPSPANSLFNPFLWIITPSLMKLFKEGSSPPKT